MTTLIDLGSSREISQLRWLSQNPTTLKFSTPNLREFIKNRPIDADNELDVEEDEVQETHSDPGYYSKETRLINLSVELKDLSEEGWLNNLSQLITRLEHKNVVRKALHQH